MFNFLTSMLKYKLTAGLRQKWYYWSYLNTIFFVFFCFFIYSLWVIFPTNLYDFFIYTFFFWIGLILVPIYWCWIWVIFFLYICGIKIPFILYPLGMGLAACRLGILILFFLLIWMPIRFCIFYIHKFLQNTLINILLIFLSFYHKTQIQKENLLEVQKTLSILKKWIRNLIVFNVLNIIEWLPGYLARKYIKMFVFFKNKHRLKLLYYFIIRCFYYFKVKYFFFLHKFGVIKRSKNFYIRLILKNIEIIQKTQRVNIDTDIALFNKKFITICKEFNINPRTFLISRGYDIHVKQQKLYDKYFSNDNK